MAEFRPVQAVVRPLLDAMQTMPSFVYLIPAMMLFGLGKVPAVLSTLIYAAPPVIRLTHLGLEHVSKDAQEAALAYGATRWQLLKEVRLPLAMPSLLAGVNQTTMMALAMVIIAAMIGARGVGEEVLIAINRIDIGRGFEAGISVVALAIVIDRLTQGFASAGGTTSTSASKKTGGCSAPRLPASVRPVVLFTLISTPSPSVPRPWQRWSPSPHRP